MTGVIATSQTILVVGGGVSGMTAALESAECGRQVLLVEKTPTLGGRTALLYRYFPKQAGLDGHVIKPTKLQEIAVRVVPVKK